MVKPRTTEFRISPLVGLAPEVQRLIFDNLNQFDLNRLCLTCKTFKSVVLPTLYHTVDIKAPQRWSRLPSLEGLLSSSGDGLKHTKALYINIQQDPLRDSQLELEDSRPPEETEGQYYLPQSSTSNALNSLIRLLLFKLPHHQLRDFRWRHSSELDVPTLELLGKTQASLRYLSVNRYSSSCDSLGALFESLEELEVDSMDLARGDCEWAAAMVVKHAKSLNHLSVGFSTHIAHESALDRVPRYDEMSTSFRSEMKDALHESHLKTPIHLSLDSLHLCGLDFGKVIEKKMGLDIDFDKITRLRLESCPRLAQALSQLTSQGSSSNLGLGALVDLHIRLENPVRNFPGILQSFLTSIRGLSYLQVLIDGAFQIQDLEPIVKVHGQTLQGLLWDERSGPRTSLHDCTHMLSHYTTENLRAISRNCSSLRELGIPLNWEAIRELSKLVRRYCKRMPHLKSLNIRNLPTTSERMLIPTKHIMKGLAAMFMDIVNREEKSSLTTIALGAPRYSDTSIGHHHVVGTAVSDFIHLRVYHIDYDYRSPTGPSIVLSEIVKGAARTSEEDLFSPRLLHTYWLG